MLGTKRWYNFDNDLRLYHGTSSVFIPSITKYGLLPPLKSLSERVADAIRMYGFEADEKLLKACVDTVFWNEEGAICLHPSQISAARYSRHYKNGGELNDLVKYKLEKKIRRKLPNLHPNSFPIVVEVVLPVSWLEKHDGEFIQRMHSCARRMAELTHYTADEEKDHFIQGAGEFRLMKKIPPSRITRIMESLGRGF
ncbi:MAG: hypothetical protein M0R80_01125 [Proteobacteria bacterium]|nr:hypothetical protein [Pseudomonadota bacterium]